MFFIDAENHQEEHRATISFVKEIGQGNAVRRPALTLLIYLQGVKTRVNFPTWEFPSIVETRTMDQFEAFILAGGASSRMGTDKAQLLIGNESFLQHIATVLFAVTDRVTVVGRDINDNKLSCVKDVYSQWGALGGLHGALTACKSEWAFIVACDLPFITQDLVQSLLPKRSGHDAVVPIQPDNRPQPLCAFYRKGPCLKRATELIQQDFRRPLDLLESVDTLWIPFTDLNQLPGAEKFFVNINTPEDYYEATRNTAH